MKNGYVKFSETRTLQEVVIDTDKKALTLSKETLALDKCNLDVPINGTVYGTLLNYKGELEKLGSQLNEAPYKNPPVAPVLYIKPVNTLNRSNKPIPLPNDTRELQIGAALGIVFNKVTSMVSEQNALDYVLGYTIVNDVSIPHESYFRPAIKQKARDGFCPVAPWIVKKEEIANPDNLEIKVFINGELRQQNSTANLVRSVVKLISDVSQFMTFNEGDTLLVGVPENQPLVQNLDHIRIEIEGIGSLENTVKL
ncbi:fumarylacetoacetate hydrolase family protein [Metabacillus endolithicus]|uniref:Fumarylacetoacetate hydrolase family protein n=1 Tax=Metabacillus endolithicus TaxID=1535204 RepID=A0ABW5BZ68_9BACI|nr:fumarylacetoacetate hydrolase family protein [Metabacillus endolithicus]UPG62457.1 fumarylacetoacetate hydrolase family protein [Metabacillus endolithicus]